MTKLYCVKIPTRSTKVPIAVSHCDARPDPNGWRMLYVLGFGVAGAILADGFLLVYFSSHYASC